VIIVTLTAIRVDQGGRMPGRIIVTRETTTGRNEAFRDTRTGREMSRSEFAWRIQHGEYPNYHVRRVGGQLVPASNPDDSEGNNLG
jgi:hypothetical protein